MSQFKILRPGDLKPTVPNEEMYALDARAKDTDDDNHHLNAHPVIVWDRLHGRVNVGAAVRGAQLLGGGLAARGDGALGPQLLRGLVHPLAHHPAPPSVLLTAAYFSLAQVLLSAAIYHGQWCFLPRPDSFSRCSKIGQSVGKKCKNLESVRASSNFKDPCHNIRGNK